MRSIGRRSRLLVLVAAAIGCGAACRPDAPAVPQRTDARLVWRAEPRTFNPLAALDASSLAVVHLTHGTLFRVDAVAQTLTPGLAVRLDGPDASGRATLVLARDVTFPDGEAFGSDDVVFSLTVLQDPAVGSPYLQALRLGGRALRATAVDAHTVTLEFGGTHPDPERLLASVPMLPRHRLEAAHRDGTVREVWSTATPPGDVIGLGPFRLEAYVPGERLVLVRNAARGPDAGAAGRRPALERLTVVFVADPEQQVARLQSGDVDLVSAIDTRLSAVLAPTVAEGRIALHDLGPSLEYVFLLWNLDDAAGSGRARARAQWFHDGAFRKAVSMVLDRAAMARLAYDGRATPLGAHVSPGNTRWHAGVAAPSRDVEAAKSTLTSAGYGWDASGRLIDRAGRRVTFTILTATNNPQRQRLSTLIQDDLAALGLEVGVAPIEFRALVERVTRTRDFDTAIMALGGGDVDPNAELGVWQLDGATHLWRPGAPAPLAPWEAEIDRLMKAQSVSTDARARHALYARVQALVAEHLPIVPLVSPNHLVAVRTGLQGVRPAVVNRDSLWNVAEWTWAPDSVR